MNWLDKQVSFYQCAADNTGTAATYRQILLTRFAVEHEYYYKIYPEDKASYPSGKWTSGIINDLDTIIKLRTGVWDKREQVVLKQTMQCYTPAALLQSKKKSAIVETHRTGILQLDFDYNDIKDYDIDELKQAVFALDFIAFCGLSCSGKGFYALALIDDPYKLDEYAEHCFVVLLEHGIKADTTKGRNVNDLRFVSYDANMLIRDEPTPLKVNKFKKLKTPAQNVVKTNYSTVITANDGRIRKGLKDLSEVQQGTRWQEVGRVSYTLGGLGNSAFLHEITRCIKNNPAFAGEEGKYIERAEVCFNIGMKNPLPTN